jgi:hypothetical protein
MSTNGLPAAWASYSTLSTAYPLGQPSPLSQPPQLADGQPCAKKQKTVDAPLELNVPAAWLESVAYDSRSPSPFVRYDSYNGSEQDVADTCSSSGTRAVPAEGSRPRWTPRPEDLRMLEAVFDKESHPPEEELASIAKTLGVTSRRVEIWLQNRRQKARKAGTLPRARKTLGKRSSDNKALLSVTGRLNRRKDPPAKAVRIVAPVPDGELLRSVPAVLAADVAA